MHIHLLSGFLGSGKTTAIQQVCAILMQQGKRVGVITNDQGIKLVDSGFFNSLKIPYRQVTNGCFCCNYQALDDSIQSLLTTGNPDIIFAESVGSCTDIVATVMKPLLKFRNDIRVTVSTFADARLLYMLLTGNNRFFDKEVLYIYNKQLEEAGNIVISKIDLLKADESEEIQEVMSVKYAGKTLLYHNSFDAENIQRWLQVLSEDSSAASLPSLSINYDVYGAGEAKLAWLDEEITIQSNTGNATQTAVNIINAIYKKIRLAGYTIGHLKYLLNGHIKISYTAATKQEDTHITSDLPTATLLINARVQTTPEILSHLVQEVLKEESKGNYILITGSAAFQPGYPQPAHRICT